MTKGSNLPVYKVTKALAYMVREIQRVLVLKNANSWLAFSSDSTFLCYRPFCAFEVLPCDD